LPGFEAFFAVTHQGPAQGGKAGGSVLPDKNITKYTQCLQLVAVKSLGIFLNIDFAQAQ
jgi:hypothetical protein